MKKFHLIFLLYFLLFPTLTTAHAVVRQKSAKIAPLTANKLTEITLQFNSSVEVSLAQFFLVKEGDKQQKLEIRAGETKGEIKIIVPALNPGRYALKFKVFASDSHLTDDVIYFWVK
jgi:methionine-rich copper-binding protein CopC